MADFDRVAREGSWQDFRFKIGFEAFDQGLVRLSWLRAAYLAWFAALGYRFILRSEMAPIRAKIRHFDSTAAPLRFRMLVRNQTLRPQLVIIDEPSELRCFAMLYEFNAILLPRVGDSDLYERLAKRPDSFSENLSGFEVPWPSGPAFAWDQIA